METKSVKKILVPAVRSSRRLRGRAQTPGEAVDGGSSKLDEESGDNNHQLCPQLEQQLKPKAEKESASLLNSEAPAPSTAAHKILRVTRSRCNISSGNNHEIDVQLDQFTPEDYLVNKTEDQDTSKKISKSTSAQDCSEAQLLDLVCTVKKPIRACDSFTSPYSEMRKSYRKLHKREIVSIPYRKCHDALEGRIVTILNKLENGKNCLRDFEGLIEKMGRIASKDLRNRFIISGIRTILAVSLEKETYDPKLIAKLQEEERKLQQRIAEELEAFEEYQSDPFLRNELNGEDSGEFKSLMVRKLYQILKKKHPSRRKELRELIWGECSKLFSGDINMNTMIKFIRQRLEI